MGEARCAALREGSAAEQAGRPAAMAPPASLHFVKPLAYSLLNVVSASGIVFANKSVFQHFDYKCAACVRLPAHPPTVTDSLAH